MTHGTFSWNELMTDDVEKAKAFFTATVGWEYDAMPLAQGGTYWIAVIDDEAVGGIVDMTGTMPPGTRPHWFSFLEVDDVDARVAAIESAGGQLLRPPFDVDGIGRVAIVADTTGAAMGWITSLHIDDEDEDDDDDEFDDDDDQGRDDGKLARN